MSKGIYLDGAGNVVFLEKPEPETEEVEEVAEVDEYESVVTAIEKVSDRLNQLASQFDVVVPVVMALVEAQKDMVEAYKAPKRIIRGQDGKPEGIE